MAERRATQEDEPGSLGPAERRGTAALLVVLGVLGAIVFGAALIGLGMATSTALSAGDPSTSIQEGRRAVSDSATALRAVDQSLGTTAQASLETAQSLDSFAATLKEAAATSGQVDVLGQRPFAGLAQLFSATADLATTAAGDLRTSAESIAAARISMEPLAGDLDKIAGRLDAVSGSAKQLVNPWIWWLLLAGCAWLFAASLMFIRLGWVLWPWGGGATASGRRGRANARSRSGSRSRSRDDEDRDTPEG